MIARGEKHTLTEHNYIFRIDEPIYSNFDTTHAIYARVESWNLRRKEKSSAFCSGQKEL